MIVDQVRVGTLQPLPREGQRTGMYKQPVDGPVKVGIEGLEGDHQGDRSVHGGPDKAVHLYPTETYPLVAARRPDLAALLQPGVLGENLVTRGITDETACIGDVYRIGTVLLQVSQPRRPCWKIDHRLDTEGMVPLLNEIGRPGWYFRVLQTGTLQAGDAIELVERPAVEVSIAHLFQTFGELRPDPAELRRMATAPGMTQGWIDRLVRRADWLESHDAN